MGNDHHRSWIMVLSGKGLTEDFGSWKFSIS